MKRGFLIDWSGNSTNAVEDLKSVDQSKGGSSVQNSFDLYQKLSFWLHEDGEGSNYGTFEIDPIVSDSFFGLKGGTFHTAEESGVTQAEFATKGVEEYAQEFERVLKHVDLEYGIDSEADSYLDSVMKRDLEVARKMLVRVYTRLWKEGKSDYVLNFFTTLSHFTPEQVGEVGELMALASLANSNPLVNEAGIRLLENWGTDDAIRLLKGAKCADAWVDKYREDVISDLLAANAVGKKG